MEKQTVFRTHGVTIILGILVLIGLYLTSLYSYLLFHSFAEIFGIIVACGIFIVAWNSRRFLDNNYLLLLGIAYLFVGIIDLIHTLSYTGMYIFHGSNTNLPTQLWIAARYLESVSLLIAPLFFRRRLRIKPVFAAYALVTSLALGSIFYLDVFPVCFVDGVGLTPFKKISEYVICLILLASLVPLFEKREEFDRGVFRMIAASIVLTIGSELSFTFYVHAYGLSNLIGHYLKIISFYLLYKALIETGLRNPYNLLFRNLSRREEELRQSEKRFRQAFENANTGMTLVSPGGRYLVVNDVLLRMLGYSREELESMAVQDTVHPEDEHVYSSFVSRALAGEIESSSFETRHLGKDARVVWTHVASSLVRDERGEPVYFITQMSDVTDRRLAEDALKWELGLNEAIAELSKALVAQASIEDISYHMLERAKSLTNSEFGFVGHIDPKTGYLISSTITRDIWDICLVKDKDVVFKKFTGLWGWVLNNRKPLLANSPSEDPRSSGTPEGHVPIRRFIAVPALVGDILVGIIALANPDRDYTGEDLSLLERLADLYAIAIQRKWHDDALRESERKYRLLIDNLPNVVFKGYLDWSVEFIDEKIEMMTGFKREDFHSKRMKWDDVIVEEDIEYVKDVFIRALKAGRPYVREYRIRTRAKETIWVQEWSQIVLDDKGEPDFITGTFMDVTSRKSAEQKVMNALSESRQREAEVSALLDGSRSVLEHAEFEGAARAIFDAAKRIIGATAGYVALLSEDGSENEVVFLDSGGLDCTVDPDLPMPIRGLRAKAYHSGKVVYDNAFADSKWLEYMPEGHAELESVMFAPMIIHGRVEGLMGLANKPGGYTENDARMASAFSELAAVALYNSRTLEERKRAEMALKKAHDELEVRVEERTGELVQAKNDLRDALVQEEQLKDRLDMENIYLQEEIKLNHNFEEIIGRSKVMRRVLGRVEQVASTDATVLIMGETGTGKELFARAIHNLSPRNDRPLVKVNCAALQETLIESELFGHEKGAFTGAFAQRVGRFELANNGTIFLDEIGDLSLELQSKLLRVIQEGELERLGGSRTIKVDVRLLAATHRDLQAEVNAGRFREDLFYRLHVFPIVIPPLRERSEDISLLVRHFSQRYSTALGKAIDNIPQKVMEALEAYRWSGNVRELENVIERAVILARGSALELEDDFLDIFGEAGPRDVSLETLDEVQRNHIIRTLEETNWTVEGKRGAAVILGINPSTLRSRMRKFGIKRDLGMG